MLYLKVVRLLAKVLTFYLPRKMRRCARLFIIENEPVVSMKRLMSRWKYVSFRSKRKASVVVYTAICGGYDELKVHTWLCKDWDYVCFSDVQVDGKSVWDVRMLDACPELNTNLQAKIYKCFPFYFLPGYDYSIWVDGNCDFRSQRIRAVVESFIKSDLPIGLFSHPDRKCIYDEAEACLLLKKDEPQNIKAAISFLQNEEYPHQHGLYEMGIIVRRHKSKSLIRAMDLWWCLIREFTKRDQLSFCFVAWVLKLPVFNLFPSGQSVRTSSCIIYRDHKR